MTLRLTADLKRELDDYAQAVGLTRSALVRAALDRYDLGRRLAELGEDAREAPASLRADYS